MLTNLLLTIIIIQALFLIHAVITKRRVTIGLSYAVTFIILTIITFLGNYHSSATQTILTILIVLWGVRLALFLLYRNLHSSTDTRLTIILQNNKSISIFIIIQSIVIFVFFIPTYFAIINGKVASNNNLYLLGITIAIFGLAFETIADIQKFAFKKRDPEKFIDSGVWSISQHSNYFGEFTFWLGIALVNLAILGQNNWWVLMMPLYLYLLLRFVTGVPVLQQIKSRRYGNSKKYQKYTQKTPVFTPIFTKNNLDNHK